MQNQNWNGFLVYFINQWRVDTFLPRMEKLLPFARVGCAGFWSTEKCLHKWRWCLFFVVTTHLFDKAICTITAKQQFFWILVSQNVTSKSGGIFCITDNLKNFHSSLSICGHRHTFGLNNIFQYTWHLQSYLELSFETIQTYKFLFQTPKKNEFVWFSKGKMNTWHVEVH